MRTYEAKPSLLQELRLYENFVALQATLNPLIARHPLAKVAYEAAREGAEKWVNQVKHYYDHIVEHASEPVLSLPAKETQVRKYIRALIDSMLLKEMKPVVETLRRENRDPVSLANALAKAAGKSKYESLRALGDEAGVAVQELLAARERVANGGHAILDQELAEALKEIWTLLDEAYDLLGVVLRRLRIVDDPTYLARPTIRSPLRPALASPAVRPVKKKAKRKAKGTKGQDAAKGEKTVAKPEEKPAEKPAETPAETPETAPTTGPKGKVA